MTPDEHRAEAERLLRELRDHLPPNQRPQTASAMAQAATAHAVLAQTPQPVTVAADPDAGLADMLTAARVAGSGDGQAILAGRAMAGEQCVCGHRRGQHYRGRETCLAAWHDGSVGNRVVACLCRVYVPVGSEPEPGGEE